MPRQHSKAVSKRREKYWENCIIRIHFKGCPRITVTKDMKLIQVFVCFIRCQTITFKIFQTILRI